LSLQLDGLKDAGCEEIYQEKLAGSTKERPKLLQMLDHLRHGDVIVVWKLNRLARSLKDLVGLVNELREKGAGLSSLNDQIDTTTPHGKFTFHIFTALAEFERDIIREWTMSGLAAARARGRKGGPAERIIQEGPTHRYNCRTPLPGRKVDHQGNLRAALDFEDDDLQLPPPTRCGDWRSAKQEQGVMDNGQPNGRLPAGTGHLSVHRP